MNPESCGAQTAWPAEVTERYDWPQNFMKPDVSAPGTARLLRDSRRQVGPVDRHVDGNAARGRSRSADRLGSRRTLGR